MARAEDEIDQVLLNTETELDLFKLDFEDEILEASLNKYQEYLDQLHAATDHLDCLLAATTATLDQLADITKAFQAIDTQTAVFQTQSTEILAEQRHNERLAADVAENLKYYEPLERISRRMNAPGAGSFVRQQDFRDMLLTLDECLDYMQTHSEQKEAEAYRARYKQILTRALTLVRNTFIAGVKDVTNEVGKKIYGKSASDTILNTMLYARFRVDAPAMRDLGLEIQKRAVPSVDDEPGTEPEYQSLMNELHQVFVACRTRLVLPLIQQKLTTIAASASSQDLVAFARASMTYIRGVCLDEFELWSDWFHSHRGVYDLLEQLCEPVYDLLRPRVIHESKLSKLCSLVTLLQTRYSTTDDEDSDHEVSSSNQPQLDFGTLIRPALEDAQTRLVFRTLALLRNEIEYYKPSDDDLDYPRRMASTPTPVSASVPLSGKKSSAIAPLVEEDVSDDEMSANPFSRTRQLDNAYPTLPRSIRLLSRIYRLLNTSIFDDLAHQIVHTTTLSLLSASRSISARHSPADGQLFLLRHLLLLKQSIVAFDIEYLSADVQFDFSGVTNTFQELRDRGGLFNPLNWVTLVRSGGLVPKVVENMLDAKVELDGQLRIVINDFTSGFAATMSGGLHDLTKDDTALAEAARVVREKIKKEVPILRAKLEQYLDDLRTRETLVAAVEDQVVQAYETFFDKYTGASQKGRVQSKISRKGKGPEGDVWDADTFLEWAEGVFNVILPQELTSNGIDGESRSLSGSRSS